MKRLSKNPLSIILLMIILAGSLAFLTSRYFTATEKPKEISKKLNYPAFKPVDLSSRSLLTPNPDPAPTPTPIELAPEPEISTLSGWEAGSKAKPETSRKFQTPGFIHFSGIVIEKTANQIRIEDLESPPASISQPLTILAGANTLIIIHDPNINTGTGLRFGAWSEIPLNALVGATGYYFELDGKDYLDTSTVDWRGRRGEIEIIAFKIDKSLRK